MIGDEYTNIDDFYAADARRRRSVEVDYGVNWAVDPRRPSITARVSYVVDTNELVFVPDPPAGLPVTVIAEFEDRDACELALLGWSEAPPRLAWIFTRIPFVPVCLDGITLEDAEGDLGP